MPGSMHLFSRLLPAFLLIALPSCGEDAKLPTTPEQLAAEMQRVSNELQQVIASVRDSATAQAAEEKVTALREQIELLYQQALELELNEQQMRQFTQSARTLLEEMGGEVQALLQSPEIRGAIEQISRLLTPGRGDSEDSPTPPGRR